MDLRPILDMMASWSIDSLMRGGRSNTDTVGHPDAAYAIILLMLAQYGLANQSGTLSSSILRCSRVPKLYAGRRPANAW
jgi:hypothetical protein